MARVDKDGDLRRDMAAMKGEVLQTVQRSNRPSRLWLGCSGIVLVVLLLSLMAVGWVVAATGLAQVPVLTNLAYHRPEPAHQVVSTTPLDAYLGAVLSHELTDRLRAGNGTLADRDISIDVKEGMCTATLRQALMNNAQTAIDANGSQVTIDPDGLELYLPLAGNALHSAILLRLRIEAGQDGLTASVSDLRLGSLPIANVVTRAALLPVIQNSIAGFEAQLARYAAITSITYAPGAATLKGTLSPGAIPTP